MTLDGNAVRSVDRAAALLLALGESHGEAGVTELARRLGVAADGDANRAHRAFNNVSCRIGVARTHPQRQQIVRRGAAGLRQLEMP